MEEENYLAQIKKCVTFIFIKENGNYTPKGTGFFVGVKVDDKDDKHVIYLVTAKHVLQSDNNRFHNEIYLRLNTKENTAFLFPFLLPADELLTHPDKSVDIVAFPCSLDSKIIDYLTISDSYFADAKIIEEKRISEGDDIFYVGLFFPYFGNQKNHPLIRFGKVSSLTNEKVRITKPNEPFEEAHLYFFESQTLGGFSGSPVFFQLDRLRNKMQIQYGNPEVYLAGIMKGHYRDFIASPVLELKDNILREQNLGIAAITPCYLLKEILFSSSEVESRNKLIDKL